MEQFTADQKLGKKLYRSVRRNFKRWRYGMISSFAFLLLGAGEAVWTIKKASGAGAGGIFVIAVAAVFLPALFACFSYAAAISGGREVLGNRIGERIIFADSYLILEYVPHARETTVYDRIQYRVPYDRVTGLVYQRRLGRLQISGDYEVRKYRSYSRGDVPENMARQEVDGTPFYLYAYYEDFDRLLASLRNRTGREIKEEV